MLTTNTFVINGRKVEVDAEVDTPLLWIIREQLEADEERNSRLRHRAMWGVHGACRGQCCSPPVRCLWKTSREKTSRRLRVYRRER